MESVKKVLEECWDNNPEMHKPKHCIYQGKKLEEINNLYFVKNKLNLSENEIIYLVVHGTTFPGLPGWKAGGFAITNFGLHFDTHKDGFFSSLLMFPQGPKGFINFEDLKSIQIGNHDRCYGTSYNGHNLVINGEEYGLIRMAKAIEYDEPLIKYCNKLFSNLVGVCLESPPDLINFPGTII